MKSTAAQKLGSKEAKEWLRKCLLTGKLAQGKHAKTRKAERRFSDQDLIRALWGGAMITVPELVDDVNGFYCVMKICLDDSRWLEVPIIVDIDKKRIFVKSLVWKQKGK